MAIRDITEILRDLNDTYEAADEDGKAGFFDSMQKHAKDAHTSVFSVGFASGKKEGGKGKTALDTEIKKLKEDLTTAQAEADELRAKVPGAEQLKTEYDQKATKLQEDFNRQLSQRDQKDRQRDMESVAKDIQSALVEAGLRPSLARGKVLELQKDGVIKQRDDDGAVEFYQLGKLDTPYPPAAKDAKPWDGLVADVMKKADPNDKSSTVTPGGGVRGGPGGGAPGAPQESQIIENKRRSGMYSL